MKTKTVIPTGQTLTKFCEINTQGCESNKQGVVTIIKVDDKDTYVCNHCLHQMIREEKWYISGARVC